MSLSLQVTSFSIMCPLGYRRKIMQSGCYSPPDNLTSHKAQGEKNTYRDLCYHMTGSICLVGTLHQHLQQPWDYTWQDAVNNQFPVFQEGLPQSHSLIIPDSNSLLSIGNHQIWNYLSPKPSHHLCTEKDVGLSTKSHHSYDILFGRIKLIQPYQKP